MLVTEEQKTTDVSAKYKIYKMEFFSKITLYSKHNDSNEKVKKP